MFREYPYSDDALLFFINSTLLFSDDIDIFYPLPTTILYRKALGWQSSLERGAFYVEK